MTPPTPPAALSGITHLPQHNKVTLTFADLSRLWAFVNVIGETDIEVNARHLTLYCKCSEEQVTLALPHYGGKIMD